jgi:hypothetical protein
MKKLPDDAYAYYLVLGARRSHQAVATHFGVDKKTVTNRAVQEKWKEKIDEHDRTERERLERKAAQSLETMNDRHLKLISFVQAKSIEALKAMPLDSAIDAVRALSIAIEKERVIRGEPTQRTTIDIERRIREEHERYEEPEEPVIPEEVNADAGDAEPADEPDAAPE